MHAAQIEEYLQSSGNTELMDSELLAAAERRGGIGGGGGGVNALAVAVPVAVGEWCVLVLCELTWEGGTGTATGGGGAAVGGWRLE